MNACCESLFRDTIDNLSFRARKLYGIAHDAEEAGCEFSRVEAIAKADAYKDAAREFELCMQRAGLKEAI